MAVFITGAGIPPSVLPAGYTKLNYVQSSGAQYINTGFSDSLGFRAKMNVTYESVYSGLNVIIGSHDAAAPYNRNFFAANSGGNWELGAYDFWDFGSFSVGTNYEIDVSTVSGNCRAIINGNTYTQTPPSTARSSLPVYLFGLNYPGGLLPSKAKMFGCKLYDHSGVLVREFIPCINPQNVFGLYDLVGKRFYGNAGSGSFTGG